MALATGTRIGPYEVTSPLGEGGWSHKGNRIFYAEGLRIMAADYETAGDSFSVSTPQPWSPTQVFAPGYSFFDLAPNEKQFAVFLDPKPPAEKSSTLHITFLFHFFDELRRRAPAVGGR
jgi:hypothetical protein